MNLKPGLLLRRYIDLLEKVDAPSLMASMEDEFRKNGIIYDGRPTPVIMAPYFITRSQVDMMDRCVTSISGVLETAARAYRDDPSVKPFFHVSPVMERLMAVESGYAKAIPVARWDAFLHEESVKLLEFNADSPAGFAYTDAQDEVFSGVPVFQELVKECRIDIETGGRREACLAEMLDCYTEWCATFGRQPRELPTIAIIDWREVKIIPEFILWKRFFESRGHVASIIDPRDLRVEGDRLVGFPIEGTGDDTGKAVEIDLIYRRMVSYELDASVGERGLVALLDALERGLACMVNPFQCNVGTSKGVLAFMSDPENGHHFSRQERAAVAEFIPWTRLLREASTGWKGGKVDLVTHVKEHREDFVIKAARGRGGKAVVIGMDDGMDDDAWHKAVDEAVVDGGWVVQEVVPFPEMDFPMLRDGKIVLERKRVNINPFVVGGKYANATCRVSDKRVINIGAGGGLLPVYALR